MGGINRIVMSASTLESRIAWHSKDTGIPQKELRRMCLQAGLEQLQKGELKVSTKKAAKGGSK